VPPRIATQRTIASASIFALFLGGAFFLLIYFLPIWFQAVKGTDALRSGIDTIPLILSNTFGIFFSGGLTSTFGYYMPYVYICVALTSIGSGLLTTLDPTSSTGRWVGYQILYGFGCGCAFQLPQIAAQAVLPQQDVPVGVAITLFGTMLGASLFVSVGNNVLNNGLVSHVSVLNIQGLDAKTIVSLGATQLRSHVPSQYVAKVIEGYNTSVIETFRVALIISCLSVLGAAGMQWRSVKAPKPTNVSDGKANV
jgi:MFS family permease